MYYFLMAQAWKCHTCCLFMKIQSFHESMINFSFRFCPSRVDRNGRNVSFSENFAYVLNGWHLISKVFYYSLG